MWEMVNKTHWGQGWVVPRAVVSSLAIQPRPASNMCQSMIISTVFTHFGALVGCYVSRTEVITVSVKLKQLWENTCHGSSVHNTDPSAPLPHPDT